MSRLPIFHDDRSFHEQTERMFREMQEKIGFHHPPPNPAANVNVFRDFVAGGWPPAMDDHAFFQLQPSTTMTRQVFICTCSAFFVCFSCACCRFWRIKDVYKFYALIRSVSTGLLGAGRRASFLAQTTG